MDPKPPRYDLEQQRRSVDDLGARNRLINLPRESREGCLYLEGDPDELRERLADGVWVRMPAADADRSGPGLQDGASIDRLMRLQEILDRTLGIEAVMLGLGIATWSDGTLTRKAPLILIQVEIETAGDEHRIRQIGTPMLNLALLRRCRMPEEAFPDDPLRFIGRDGPLQSVEPRSVLGLFTTARTSLTQRLDPERYGQILRNPRSAGLIGPDGSADWSGPDWAEGPEGAMGRLDAAQRRAMARAHSGDSFQVRAAPGTGKTEVLAAIAQAAMLARRQTLVVSETPASLDALAERLGDAIDGRVLRLYGPSAQPRALAARLGLVTPGRPVDLLRGLTRTARPVTILASCLSYLDHVPEEWTFDLVLVDEASQVSLAHALPAIAASRQVIICGDPRQMRPQGGLAHYFDNVVSSTHEPSLLDAAAAAGMPEMTLTHHYRSRHPGLIQGSNRLFYQDDLRFALAPRPSGSRGLSGVAVEGVYDRRDSRTNQAEAQAVVGHARRLVEGAGKSVIVIATTEAQRGLIALRLAEAGLPLAGRSRVGGIVVIRPEEAQGLECDIALISLTVGPDRRGGRVPESLSALGFPDDERIVNVMMTRAREATVLFASVTSRDLARGRSTGQNALILFLKIAELRASVPAKPYEGPWTDRFAACHCKAFQHGKAILLEDLAGRSIGALYVSEDPEDHDEAAEMHQLVACGWKVERVVAGDDRLTDRIASLVSELRTRL